MGSSQDGWATWLRDGLALLALVLALLLTVEGIQTRSLQDRVNAGRADLIRAQTLATVDGGVIQLLAKTSVEKNDPELSALLARNGVTLRTRPATAPAPPAGGAGR